MTCHYPDLGWLKILGHPIRETNKIWVVTRHKHEISTLVSETSFCRETCGGITKCRLFTQATTEPVNTLLLLNRLNCIAISPYVISLLTIKTSAKTASCFGWEEIIKKRNRLNLQRQFTQPFKGWVGKRSNDINWDARLNRDGELTWEGELI